MVTLFITAFAILVLIGIGIYFWQKPAADYSENVLPPSPNARGLFADDASSIAEENERLALAASDLAESLIARAKKGEHSALDDAHSSNNSVLYDRVLTELVHVSESNPRLLGLMSHISQNDLPVNQSLALAAIASWKRVPDRSGTAKALHFAALSDDSDTYREAVESALGFWREGKLEDVSAVELKALFDGEFWILSAHTRSSGAGFVLRRTLESARRELEAASAK